MTGSCNQAEHQVALTALAHEELSGPERSAARKLLLRCESCREELGMLDQIQNTLHEAAEAARTRPLGEGTEPFRSFMRRHIALNPHGHGLEASGRRTIARLLWAAAALLLLAAGWSWVMERPRSVSPAPDVELGLALVPSGAIAERPAALEVRGMATGHPEAASWEIELGSVERTLFTTKVADLDHPIALPGDLVLERGVPYVWSIHALDEFGRRVWDHRPLASTTFQIQ